MILSRGSEKPDVETPAIVADHIYTVVSDLLKPRRVVDIGIGFGSLSRPWRLDAEIIGIDKRSVGRPFCDKFLHLDFLRIPQSTFKPSLILSNPPWTGYHPTAPYLFLKKCHELWGKATPAVWITPTSFLHNLTRRSHRYPLFADLNITGVLPLPRDCYGEGINVWSTVLFLNLPGIKPMDFLPPEAVLKITGPKRPSGSRLPAAAV